MDYFNILGANSGELNGYGGNDTYIKCHFKLYTLTNYTWAAQIKLSFEWADPRANISVTSNIGEDCVSTTKDYILYGESSTITAKEVQGYHFVKWSDGNTNASRTITLNDDFLATYQKHITELEYEAVYEVNKINNIYVNTVQPKAIYHDNNNIVFVVDGTIPTAAASIFDTVDGFHIKVQNTVPSGMTEVKEVYIDTTKVYG